MVVFNKVKWILGILMVFVLIISTNLIDRNNFLRVKDSVIAIYDDRLVAHDLIFEMSRLMQEKEVAIAKSDSNFFNKRNRQVNSDIRNLILKFEQTNLTIYEGNLFKNLKIDLESLKNAETKFIESKVHQKTALTNQLLKVKKDLFDLSKVQLNEGRQQMSISKKAIDTIELFTQLEIYVLILLAIIIQVIIIYKPKEK